jgi:RHS repeat-associated protein
MRRVVPVHLTEDPVPNPCSQLVRRAAALLPMLVMLVMALATPAAAQNSTTKPASTVIPLIGGTVIPEVTPDGASVTASVGANSYVFTVRNGGTGLGTMSTDPTCSGAASACTASVASFGLAAGASRTVTVNYTGSSAGGTGTVNLQVDDASGVYSDQGYITITVPPAAPTYIVSVTPDGAAYSMPAGTSSYNFTVANTGTGDATYTLASSCAGMVSGCSAPASVYVPHGTSVPVTVSFSDATPGTTGTASLTASYGGYSDGGSLNVSVNNSYAVSVTPDNQSQVVSPNGSVSFYVMNLGSVQTTFQFSVNCGCSLSILSATVNPGYSSGVNVTVSLNGYAGTVVLTASDQAHGTSDTGSIIVTGATYTVSVGPDGYPDLWLDAGQAGTANFTVSNSGNTAATYYLSGSCDAVAIGCSPFPASVAVSPSSYASVPITFTAGAAGSSGYIRLNASGPSSDAGSVHVMVASHTAAVAPPAAVSVDPGSYSASFGVTNTGNAPTTYNLTATCGGQITGCPGSLGQITVLPGATTPVSVGYTAVNRGDAGTVTLAAAWVGNAAVGGSAAMSVTVKNLYAVAVTPDNQSQIVSPGSSLTFRVTNTGTGTEQSTYSITANCQGQCTVSPLTLNNVSPGASMGQNVIVSLGTYFGTVVLTASDQAHGTSDTGSITPSAPTYNVSVSPDTNPQSVAQTIDANQPGSQTFSVYNMGNADASYNISVSCPTTYLFNCAWPTAPLAVPTGQSRPITVTFTATGSAGVGTITLTASAGSASDVGTARWQVNLVSTHYSLVTPKGGTANVYVGPNLTQVFSVKNTGNAPNSYTLTTPCLNAVTACTAAPASISNLLAGNTTSVTVTYTASAVGTGTVRLATSNTVDPAVVDTGSVNVTVNPAITVTVLPNGQTVNVEPGTSTQTFTIATNASTSTTYNLTAACYGVATGCGSASPGSVTVTSSTPAQANVTYSAATRGATGTVQLTAVSTDGSSSASGSVSVSVNAAIAVGTNSVQFKDINPGTTIERSQCLIFSIVPDVASECGALRIVHPLPAVRTLGKARVPTLIYSSDQTQGPTLAVNVTLQDTVTIPTSVQLVIVRTWPDAHLDTLTRTYAGSDWQGNRSRRLAVPNVASGGTGILRYSVAVRLVYPSGLVLAAPVDNSELAYVDRTSSSFGGGWWLAGLERLYTGQYDASVLWVAGDGSTRKYVNQHTMTGTDTVYLATALDRPDTLLHRADGKYQRQAGNGLYVEFDGFGLHKRTVNRLGYATVFTYDQSNRLSGIQLPPWRLVGSVSTPAHSYTFAYNAGSGLLETVTAPPVNGNARNVILGRNGAASKVVSITEQLDSTYQVTFDASPSLIYTSRTDRRGVGTFFTTEASSPTIATFATGTGTGTDTVRHTFRTVVGIGAAVGTTESVDSTYFRYDGPRLAPVLDITKIWLDRFGAPVRIVNALNQETLITRGDPRFPALVTQTRGPAPKLFTSRATYDERGNLKTTTQVNPHGDQVDATTTFWWHSKWNMVTQVVQPEGEVTNIVYDAATGDRSYQEDGRGSMSRVSFQYYTTTDASGAMARLLSTVTLPATATLASATTQIQYDSLGNVKTSITPRGIWSRTTNDAIGRTVRTADQISWPAFRQLTPGDSSTTTLTYDLSDRVTRSVIFGPAMNNAGAQSAIVDNAYDREGNLTRVTRTQTPDTSRVFLSQDAYPALGSLVLRYRYDNLGRKLAEIAPDSTASDSTDNPVGYSFYDLAGNVDSVRTRRNDHVAQGDVNHVIQMTYDVLNRLKTRTAPEAKYTARVDGYAKADPNNSPALYAAPYPRFPNNLYTAPNAQDSPFHTTWGGYTVRGDTAIFDYDEAGNMTKADNADARVHRQYYPNGQVQRDSLYTQTLERDTTALHKYGLEYVYDRDGRQTTLKHPVQLSPAPGYVTTSQYDPITGALLRVSDPIGYTFTYGYDARNQTISLAMPGNFNERYGYDQDGDQLTQWSGTTAALHNVTMTYDPRGKMLTLINAVAGHDSVSLRYSGLGNLIYNDNIIYLKSDGTSRQRTTENFTFDPLGNRLHSDFTILTQNKQSGCGFWLGCHTNQSSSGDVADWYYRTGTGRLVFDSHFQGNRQNVTKYDESGNTVFSAQKPNSSPASYEDRASYYGADGTLAAVDFRQISSTSGYKIAFDEYRYDALGRRVLVRSRRLCGVGYNVECTQSYVRRTIWAGSQELYEIQMPDTTILREYDTQTLPTRAVDGNLYDPNPMYGRVAYTFGLKLDQPLTVIRLGFMNRYSEIWNPFSIVPLWTVRGTADTSYFAATGATGKNCNTAGHCVLVGYPSQYWTPAYSRYFVPTIFQGTLLTDKSDHTGQLYRRNRYYDPGNGRFTQEDPIGLAGGLNAYGFAGGDPVNFSDPFGLCPECAAVGLAEFGLGAQVIPGVGQVVGGIALVASAAITGYVLYKWYNEKAGEGSTGGESAGRRATKGERQAARERNKEANEDGELHCVHCGQGTTEEPGKPNSSHIDHVQPRNPGDGGPRGNNSPKNLKNSCATCNLDKSNQRPPYTPPTQSPQ